MIKIRVNAGKGYDVIFDGINSIEKHLTSLKKTGKVCIVSDENVHKLYYSQVAKSLILSEVFQFLIESGEKSKSFSNVEKLINFLADNKFSRTDTLIALGGGVVGDLAGFAAGIYLRGIDFVQIPTTLLAAVDSSVGGKTGVNLAAGKNLAGVFHQPIMVLCDVSTFQTLPKAEWQNGFAEVIKYAFIANEKILHMTDIEEIVAECINIKRDIVQQDEFDNAIRQILNFGHTIGHAVEKCSNYKIAHGRAVAIGMNAVIKATNPALQTALQTALQKHGIDYSCSSYSTEELFEAATGDKKVADGKINIITIEKPGQAKIKTVSFEELKKVINVGIKNGNQL